MVNIIYMTYIVSRKFTYYTFKWQTVNYVLGFIILLLLLGNSGCFPCSHNNDNKKKMSLPSFPYAVSKHPFGDLNVA